MNWYSFFVGLWAGLCLGFAIFAITCIGICKKRR